MAITTYDQLKNLLEELRDSLARQYSEDSLGMSALSGMHYELLLSLENVLQYASTCKNSDIAFEPWYQYMMHGGRGDYFDGSLAKGVLRTSKELHIITAEEFQILSKSPWCDETRALEFMHRLSSTIEAICVRVAPCFNPGNVNEKGK